MESLNQGDEAQVQVDYRNIEVPNQRDAVEHLVWPARFLRPGRSLQSSEEQRIKYHKFCYIIYQLNRFKLQVKHQQLDEARGSGSSAILGRSGLQSGQKEICR